MRVVTGGLAWLAKRTALCPGAFHGWKLVEDAPYAAKVPGLVLAWMRAR
jgi:hypothetical protein